MRFSIDLNNLASRLSFVSKAAATKGTQPILATILFIAQSNEVQLVATDLEVMAIAKIPANIEEPGMFAIPAKVLTEIVNSLMLTPEQIITFSINSTKVSEFLQKPLSEKISEPDLNKELSELDQMPIVTLTSGRNHYDLPFYTVESFPPIPALEKESYPKFDMDAEILKKALTEASIAVSQDEKDWQLSSRVVCFNFTGDEKLVLVSTDGKRLSLSEIQKIKYPEEFNGFQIIPRSAIVEIKNLLSDAKQIQIGLFQKQLVFTTEKYQFLVRLVDLKYPDYWRIIPKDHSRKVVVKKQDFQKGLKIVAPIAKYCGHYVTFEIKNNEMKIFSKSSESGMSESYVPIELEGEEITISFNSEYITDFLSVVDDEYVVLELTTPTYPATMKAKDKNKQQFLYILMPAML